eukprot:3862379-Prymnesium_polylepis.1
MMRCRCPIDALPTHWGSSLAQCSSSPSLLHAIMKRSCEAPRVAVSSDIPGCTITPDATRAKRLNGLPAVVSTPSFARQSDSSSLSSAALPPFWRIHARTAAKAAASCTSGKYSRIACLISGSVASAAWLVLLLTVRSSCSPDLALAADGSLPQHLATSERASPNRRVEQTTISIPNQKVGSTSESSNERHADMSVVVTSATAEAKVLGMLPAYLITTAFIIPPVPCTTMTSTVLRWNPLKKPRRGASLSATKVRSKTIADSCNGMVNRHNCMLRNPIELPFFVNMSSMKTPDKPEQSPADSAASVPIVAFVTPPASSSVLPDPSEVYLTITMPSTSSTNESQSCTR